MSRWKYNIRECGGIELRHRIYTASKTKAQDDRAAVLEQVERCLKAIIKMLKAQNDDVTAAADLLDLIDGEAELVRSDSPRIKEFGFETPAELVDERLTEFYDICDAKSIWIGI